MSVYFQDPETDIIDQFLSPETDIMGERNYIGGFNKYTCGKDSHHHPLITRFHPSSGQHDPYSVRWSFPSELSLGVYHGVTILFRIG